MSALLVPLLAGFAILMLAADQGPERVITFIAVTVASDTGGYIAGGGHSPIMSKIANYTFRTTSVS